VVGDPYVALAQAIGLFYAEERHRAGVSPQAAIGDDVRVGKEVAIDPGRWWGAARRWAIVSC